MLYALHEIQYATFAPFSALAEFGRDYWRSPLSPFAYHPLASGAAAACELFVRLTQRYQRPSFGLDRTICDGREVAVEERPVLMEPFCTLTHFKREVERTDPIVLLVAPLSGHYATLLRDTVRALLPEHDVYITDWHDAKLVPLADGAFHFDTYVSYIMRFLRFLGRDAHVISVCQPTVPVLAAVSLMAQSGESLPRSMTMMGGPIDTRVGATEVNNFAASHSMAWFESKLIHRVPVRYPGALRRVYPGFLQHAGFVAMNLGRHIESHFDFFQHLVRGDRDSAESHRSFYDEYNAVMDLPAEYYLETIRMVFKQHDLPRGRMECLGEHIRPQAIVDTRLFTVEGELDDISGPGQTYAAHVLCSAIPDASKQHHLAQAVGHYGIFSGRKFREQICPQIRDFIRAE